MMIEIPIKRKEPVMRWIPVSERLPEECKHYLVTDSGDVEKAYFGSDKKWWSSQCDNLNGVIAWMPLPEPYKGEEE